MSSRWNIRSREEVETRKIGRNVTWTFQGLFPRCTEVDEKPGKKHDIIVSFLMKRAAPRWVKASYRWSGYDFGLGGEEFGSG